MYLTVAPAIGEVPLVKVMTTTPFSLELMSLDIDVIPADEETAAEAKAPVYDLMGRRVSDLQPSTLYIQGGKKFIVK